MYHEQLPVLRNGLAANEPSVRSETLQSSRPSTIYHLDPGRTSPIKESGSILAGRQYSSHQEAPRESAPDHLLHALDWTRSRNCEICDDTTVTCVHDLLLSRKSLDGLDTMRAQVTVHTSGHPHCIWIPDQGYRTRYATSTYESVFNVKSPERDTLSFLRATRRMCPKLDDHTCMPCASGDASSFSL